MVCAHGISQCHARHHLSSSIMHRSRRGTQARPGLHTAHIQRHTHWHWHAQRHVAARASDEQALARMARLSNQGVLDQAARRFQEGLEAGMDEDTLVAFELGADNPTNLTEMQRQYKDRIKDRLQKRADELRAEEEARRAALSSSLGLGKEAYACGEYEASVKLLEVAVEEVGPNSALGGEAQMWLALAYQACGREEDCINVYKAVETNHPLPKVRKQAGDLRYIIEAPKLELGEDERVKIPLIGGDTWRAKDRKFGYTSRLTPPPTQKKNETYWDRAQLDAPKFVPDKWYWRVAWIVLLVGTSIYGWYQTQGAV